MQAALVRERDELAGCQPGLVLDVVQLLLLLQVVKTLRLIATDALDAVAQRDREPC